MRIFRVEDSNGHGPFGLSYSIWSALSRNDEMSRPETYRLNIEKDQCFALSSMESLLYFMEFNTLHYLCLRGYRIVEFEVDRSLVTLFGPEEQVVFRRQDATIVRCLRRPVDLLNIGDEVTLSALVFEKERVGLPYEVRCKEWRKYVVGTSPSGRKVLSRVAMPVEYIVNRRNNRAQEKLEKAAFLAAVLTNKKEIRLVADDYDPRDDYEVE